MTLVACPTPEKKSYRSAAAARRFQRLSMPPPGGVKDRLYPYLCPGCGWYHLTHLRQDVGEHA